MENFYIIALLIVSVMALTFICLFVQISKEAFAIEKSLEELKLKYELYIVDSTIKYETYRLESLTKQVELIESNNDLMRKLLDSFAAF